jgi:hypothetical protein
MALDRQSMDNIPEITHWRSAADRFRQRALAEPVAHVCSATLTMQARGWHRFSEPVSRKRQEACGV